MVRRHLLPPGKFQSFEAESIKFTHDTMARIIPNPKNNNNIQRALPEFSLATIQVNRSPNKCQVKMTSKLQTLLLSGQNIDEVLASQMMPPPPPPPPPLPPPHFILSFTPSPPPLKSGIVLNAEEVEFYKNCEQKSESSCKSESSSSSNNDPHDNLDHEEDEDITSCIGNLGKSFSPRAFYYE